MNYIYLAPHLDDAALSCGAAIHRHATSGRSVRVLTLFAQGSGDGPLSPFARLQHEYWGNPLYPMLLRRAEDTAALASLGAAAQHLEYPDAVYRTSPDGQLLYTSEESIWEEPHAQDALARGSAKGLAEQLAALVPRQDTVVHAPLGAGGHVDHRIAHMAAWRLLDMGYRLAFYEEFPYAETPGVTERAIATAGIGAWGMELVPLTPADMVAKVAAMGYYRTQMKVLFGGIEAMPSRVWAFAASRSPEVSLAERLWWPSAG
jgi:LmbE family N-acetylglucosaminyl deacetylase